MSMQQQQHDANYDLLAVFNDETTAEAASSKLRSAGFTDEEIFRVTPGSGGQFREHGPNTNRRDVFLQTQRTRPSVTLILFLAIALGIVFGGGVFIVALILFFAIHIAFFILPTDFLIAGIGSVIGIIVGAITGIRRSTRVRGNIGQDMSKVNTPNNVVPTPAGARNAIALRLPASENISRKSRARAILIQNGGKIDRNVGRTE
ncbi:MAG: hypothetical protein PVS3B3_39140 [Ktedonobacteraceae bacterium]